MTKAIRQYSLYLSALVVPFFSCCSTADVKTDVEIIDPNGYNLKVQDMRVRDPFILVDPVSQAYYMQAGNNPGFKVYKSQDLLLWRDLGSSFTPAADFWGKKDFWAPDLYLYKEKYYLFGTFSADGKKRGTSILVADAPQGPFKPLVNKAVTPPNWMCLDGSLFIDNDNKPWIIYCHEWLEVTDGTVVAQRLTDDLKDTASVRQVLFKATDAPWVGSITSGTTTGYITDAPFIHKNDDGSLVMLWSSFRKDGKYAIGQAISRNGNILGPWEQSAESLNDDDGGHAMLFRDLKGRLMISYHAPNSATEKPTIKEVYIKDGKVSLNK
ncbi:MAG: glycoside hydrolase family 43 protein [Candidatus Pseudobacter hemicellulosilyticus]|uniref:Glycoside hydrolase family 43 protein n=1 Tax=Candidatus Pseudobacter hemicellulosilyticus TaxID=3121375 RepID=A0AAJ5WTR9_9BACT|nr:MAG: glycoside hydrolase family 43 protein [Pseudobacter sp.]